MTRMLFFFPLLSLTFIFWCSNKKLVGTSALLVVTGALLVVTRSYAPHSLALLDGEV